MRKLLMVGLLLFNIGCSSKPSVDNTASKVVEIRMEFQEQKDLFGNPVTPKGLGSGFFVSKDGLILTAKHCVKNTTKIVVLTSDHREYFASVVKMSEINDLALIKIDKSTPNYMKLAHKNLKRGDTVTVIGSPLGLTGTYVKGYVAKMGGSENIIDISVLPGYSGSALLNENGRVVGVVSKLILFGLGSAHLGVAVDLDAIKFFMTDLECKVL